MKKDSKATILIVDDEASFRTMISAVLVDAGYEVIAAAAGHEALEIIGRRSVDAAVLDLIMPGMDGRELMKRLHSSIPGLPVVFLTAYGSIPSAVEAIKEGASDYLTKPLPHIDDLVVTISRVIDLNRLQKQEKQVVSARRSVEPFPCASPVMKKLLETAAKVADTDVTVLITGESGTGKERMAEFIHLNSKRAAAHMISVNCAAIVETLLESELFGHEKGSFTGAVERKYGQFEQADNSSLFLDEIGEISLSLQPKLLRALQEKEFRRVGGSQIVRFNARLIAATNRDLKQQCQIGSFREDLYYRLSVFTIHIPPLRERPEDLLFLAERFATEASHKFGRDPVVFSPEVKSVLLSYGWPGNIRELGNVIEASVLLCETGVLLPENLHGLNAANHGSSVSSVGTLENAEKKALMEALGLFDGNRVKTAEYLGMSRRNLIYKLKKHNLLSR
ncbi:MAG: sigma-54-dependent Fis family transcriptional regulator [Erysipelotrichia bacterium]|nr:sigma-54-dependent Fis family transcriptional regulator [Erysipelotrichia bacterium]